MNLLKYMWRKTRLGQYPEDIAELRVEDGTKPVLCIDAYGEYFVCRRIYIESASLYKWDTSRKIKGWTPFDEFDE